ncbi:unnamed protein product, partial [Rotaria sp. Silwood2]
RGFINDDDEINENQMKTIHSQDSLNQEEELHWDSELEIIHSLLKSQQENHENTSSCSSDVHVEELLHDEQFPLSSLTTITSAVSSGSTDIIPSSSISPRDSPIRLHSTSLPSSITNETNSLLQDIFPALCTLPSSSSIIEQQINNDQYENDSASSIITEEFQPDFYYLCPVTNTTNFSITDYKTLFHDF